MKNLAAERACAVAHVGLCVPDLDRAIDWYTRALCCGILLGPAEIAADETYLGQAVTDVFGPRARVRMAHLTTGNGIAIELFEFLEPRSATRAGRAQFWEPGLTHLCIVDPDIEGRVAAIVRMGGAQRTAIWDVYAGDPYRFCHCEDPFGNLVEVYTHSHEQVYANRAGTSAPDADAS